MPLEEKRKKSAQSWGLVQIHLPECNFYFRDNFVLVPAFIPNVKMLSLFLAALTLVPYFSKPLILVPFVKESLLTLTL